MATYNLTNDSSYRNVKKYLKDNILALEDNDSKKIIDNVIDTVNVNKNIPLEMFPCALFESSELQAGVAQIAGVDVFDVYFLFHENYEGFADELERICSLFREQLHRLDNPPKRFKMLSVQRSSGLPRKIFRNLEDRMPYWYLFFKIEIQTRGY